MAELTSKQLVVQMKAFARTEALPLDATELFDTLEKATAYAGEANAYAGQTIKALVDGKYKQYILQPSGDKLTLEPVGDVKQDSLKQYVQVVDALPTSGQQQGVIYIVGTTGQIWTGTAWKIVFKEVSAQVDEISGKVTTLATEVAKKAPLENPAFTGTVTIGGDPAATKSYVDGLIGNLTSSAPGVVDSKNPLPENYKAGQTWRVAEAGTYAGAKCEAGDLIICVKTSGETKADSDFMIVQANIDGAVTSTATTATVGEIVVYDATTGKVIKGSGVGIASLNDAISKAHTHANKAVLDSYDKTQEQLLAAAAADAKSKVDALSATITTNLEGYAKKTDIPNAYTKAEIDTKLDTITENVNTKVDAATVDSKVTAAKTEITKAYTTAISTTVGDIGENKTVKEYVDAAVGSGGADVAGQIDDALAKAKKYTDDQIAAAMEVTEF